MFPKLLCVRAWKMQSGFTPSTAGLGVAFTPRVLHSRSYVLRRLACISNIVHRPGFSRSRQNSRLRVLLLKLMPTKRRYVLADNGFLLVATRHDRHQRHCWSTKGTIYIYIFFLQQFLGMTAKGPLQAFPNTYHSPVTRHNITFHIFNHFSWRCGVQKKNLGYLACLFCMPVGK